MERLSISSKCSTSRVRELPSIFFSACAETAESRKPIRFPSKKDRSAQHEVQEWSVMGINTNKKNRTSNIKLQWWRKLVLPRRGKKDSMLIPSPLSSFQLLRLRDRQPPLHKAIQAPRVTRQKHLARAEWDKMRNEAIVTIARGNSMQSMGHFIQGKHYLYPEEALFLLDRGNLDLCINGLPMSIQRAWATAMSAPDSVSLEEYLAFAYLRRAGYVVRRFNTDKFVPHHELSISFSVWRVGSFKRKEEAAPLFHLAVFRYEDAPPKISSVTSFLESTGKTRLKFALIDRGVVVLTDASTNATPLSDRYVKRLSQDEQICAKELGEGSAESLFQSEADSKDVPT